MNRIRSIAALACLVLGLPALAQTPTSQKVYTNRSLFNVPLRVAEGDRARLRELKFYAKAPGGAWVLQETGSPQTAKFTYNASVDGEYGFTIATVDTAGRETPAQPDHEPPQLSVVVDTRLPELGAMPLFVASGQAYVQCTMRDANPDLSTLIAEAQATDGSWQPLTPLDRDRPGMFNGLPSGLPARIRVSGKDKAGNAASVIVALAGGNPIDASVDAAPAMPPMQQAVLPLNPVPATATPTPPIVVPEPHVAEKPPIIETPAPIAATNKLINSHRCVLSYAVDGFDPASISRVEAFATRDGGKTWQRLGEDPYRRSPFELQLPEDGVYGIVLVVSTLGQPSPPPAAGEQPDWIVEVDATPPDVTLESANLGTGEDAGMLNLRWSVRDKNLKPDSVNVSWAHSLDGPWQPIAKGLRSDGQYRWPIAREAGVRAYLKIEAADMAGNVGRFVTTQPITLEVGKPRARVLGINPAAVK